MTSHEQRAERFLLEHFEWLESFGPTVGVTLVLRGIQRGRPMKHFRGSLASLLREVEAEALEKAAKACEEIEKQYTAIDIIERRMQAVGAQFCALRIRALAAEQGREGLRGARRRR